MSQVFSLLLADDINAVYKQCLGDIPCNTPPTESTCIVFVRYLYTQTYSQQVTSPHQCVVLLSSLTNYDSQQKEFVLTYLLLWSQLYRLELPLWVTKFVLKTGRGASLEALCHHVESIREEDVLQTISGRGDFFYVLYDRSSRLANTLLKIASSTDIQSTTQLLVTCLLRLLLRNLQNPDDLWLPTTPATLFIQQIADAESDLVSGSVALPLDKLVTFVETVSRENFVYHHSYFNNAFVCGSQLFSLIAALVFKIGFLSSRSVTREEQNSFAKRLFNALPSTNLKHQALVIFGFLAERYPGAFTIFFNTIVGALVSGIAPPDTLVPDLEECQANFSWLLESTEQEFIEWYHRSGMVLGQSRILLSTYLVRTLSIKVSIEECTRGENFQEMVRALLVDSYTYDGMFVDDPDSHPDSLQLLARAFKYLGKTLTSENFVPSVEHFILFHLILRFGGDTYILDYAVQQVYTQPALIRNKYLRSAFHFATRICTEQSWINTLSHHPEFVNSDAELQSYYLPFDDTSLKEVLLETFWGWIVLLTEIQRLLPPSVESPGCNFTSARIFLLVGDIVERMLREFSRVSWFRSMWDFLFGRFMERSRLCSTPLSCDEGFFAFTPKAIQAFIRTAPASVLLPSFFSQLLQARIFATPNSGNLCRLTSVEILACLIELPANELTLRPRLVKGLALLFPHGSGLSYETVDMIANILCTKAPLRVIQICCYLIPSLARRVLFFLLDKHVQTQITESRTPEFIWNVVQFVGQVWSMNLSRERSLEAYDSWRKEVLNTPLLMKRLETGLSVVLKSDDDLQWILDLLQSPCCSKPTSAPTVVVCLICQVDEPSKTHHYQCGHMVCLDCFESCSSSSNPAQKKFASLCPLRCSPKMQKL